MTPAPTPDAPARVAPGRADGPGHADGPVEDDGTTRLGWWDRAALLGRRARERGWWDDRTAALTLLLVGLALIGLGVTNPPPPWLPDVVVEHAGAWHVALLVVASTALVVKRRHPVAVLAVTAVCAALDTAIGGSVATILALFDALYTAALHISTAARRRLVTTVVLLVLGASVGVLVAGAPPREAVLLLLQSAALYGTPLWWAHDVRRRDELAAAEAGRAALARAHADDLERIAELDRESALREERARMARDLHDVVAGHLSAAAIRAEAALAGPPDTTADRASLQAVRSATIDALTEMRSMIVVLRGRTDAVTAPAGLARLGDLVATARAAGQDVEVDGPVPDALPAAVDHAAYRIVQEALTNVAKHAPGARARVVVARTGDTLDVRVTNPVPASTRRPADDVSGPPGGAPVGGGTGPRTGPGYDGGTGRDGAGGLHGGTGLLTMRERAEALGGSFDAGPTGDSWTVHAHLPVVVA